ncbi:MAG: HAD family hydrolase [Dehalococcoidales bacterium]|nr:MAG: HAD family hydrolase [Dehalococcoidales bacterium]
MNLPQINQPPSAIAIDLDGTLLSSNSKLSPRNRKAIERCLLKCLPIVVATSRPERSIRRLIGNELTDRCSLVMLNGAVAKAAPPLSGFVREQIPASIVEDIIKLVMNTQHECEVLIELAGHEFGANFQRDAETLWEINSATPDMVLPLEQTRDRVQTKVAVYGFEQDLSGIIAEVSTQFMDFVSVIPSNMSRFFSIVSNTASKSQALRILLNSAQISVEDVIAIGDDIPDLDMLEVCGIPIAMSNAVPEVKAICQYQTASNDEDGVAIVLEQVIEIFQRES